MNPDINPDIFLRIPTAVARAERALERAREALEQVDGRKRRGLIKRWLLEPLGLSA